MSRPQLDSLFLAALEIDSPADRAAYLDRSCGADLELRQQVEALLHSHTQAGSFLDRPAPELDALPASPERASSLQAKWAAALRESAVMAAGRSVLKAIGQHFPVPHVVLRESENREPIVRPKSPEMPERNADSRYRLDGEIARGGMGAILKGRDIDLGRDLAIKVLLDEHRDKPEIVQRFIEEAQIGGQLQHPGIAPVYELGQFSDQRPFFSMKLVRGETLAKLLANRAAPTADRGRLLGIFEQVCQTMAYAHSRGVIHRDLKPANVMVGAFGEVQVMDWGLAKVLSAGGVADEKKAHHKHQGHSVVQTLRSTGSDVPGRFGTVGSQTQLGSVMGTPAYMSPEQALGEVENLDERADVFGLGAILCEILTGFPPYVSDDATQVFRMASRGKLSDCFERLDTCGADPELAALTKQCLELEPKDRPGDAGVLTQRITRYLESVETKLRKAELERAAETARADAQAAQAEAEGKRAEAERQRAEAESRQVEQQRHSASKLRRMLAGLAVVAIVAGLACAAALVANKQANEQRSIAEEKEKEATAYGRVQLVLNVETPRVPAFIDALDEHRQWSDPLLREIFEKAPEGSQQKLHASLALVEIDPRQADYLFGRLLNAQPQELPVIRDALDPFQTKFNEQLWQIAEQPQRGQESQRLRAGAALAQYDATNPRWSMVRMSLVNDLIAAPAEKLTAWKAALRPARRQLETDLLAITRRPGRPPESRVAAEILADYAADQPQTLVDLLTEADHEQFALIYPRTEALSDPCARLLNDELKRLPAPEETKDQLAKRKTNAAVALLQMDHADAVWPLLRHSPDPSVRSYLIQRLGATGRTPAIHKRWQIETELSVRRALLLSLGDASKQYLPPADRQPFLPQVKETYQTAKDPGLHAAAEWTLRQWQQSAWLQQTKQTWAADRKHLAKQLRGIEADLQQDTNQQQARWYVNGQGQTLSVIPGPVEFWMGSPAAHINTLHWRRIECSFAIAAHEVTVEQFRRYRDSHVVDSSLAPENDCPVSNVSWFDAAAYCNWLSEQEGIPPDQWCYEPNSEGQYAQGMKAAPNFSQRTGYRLPTDAEWEYACRAGAMTPFSFGESAELLPSYAWYQANSQGRSWPVGSLMPNDLGLFDMHANALEWCHDLDLPYLVRLDGKANEDFPEPNEPSTNQRVVRGGSLQHPATDVALRAFSTSQPGVVIGFRPARTLPFRAFDRIANARTAALSVASDRPPNDAVKSKLRRQALSWLQAELAHWSQVQPPRVFVARNLWQWQLDRAFASIRNKDEIAEMPPAERHTFNTFWTDVAKLAEPANNTERLAFAQAAVLNSRQDDPAFDEADRPKLREWAIVWLKDALAAGTDSAGNAAIVALAAELDGVLDELSESAQHDGLFQAQLARHFIDRSEMSKANAAIGSARANFERRLTQADPDSAALAMPLANVLLMETKSKALTPEEMKSAGGANLAVLADLSILASGESPKQDVYTITYRNLPPRIHRLHLEVLPHESLPHRGPGRYGSHGGFALTTIRAELVSRATPGEARSLKLAKAIADFSQLNEDTNGSVLHAIDDVEQTGWSIYPECGKAHSAMFELADPVTDTADMLLRVTFEFKSPHNEHTLGRFRLLASETSGALDVEERRLAAMKLSDPWAKLAAAYLLQEDEVPDNLLASQPSLAIAMGDAHATDKNWEQAIATYSKAITKSAKDTRLLTKRAVAYEQRQQWDRAIADWSRASQLQPDIAFERFKPADAESWVLQPQNGDAPLMEVVDGNLELTTTARTKILQHQLQLEEGAEYLIRFKLKSPDGCPVTLTAASQAGDDHNIGLNKELTPTSEFQAYEFPFVAHDVSRSSNRIEFEIGAQRGKVIVKEIVLLKKSEGVEFYAAQAKDHAGRGEHQQALDALLQGLRRTDSHACKSIIITTAAPLSGMLERLAGSAPNDVLLHVELARHYALQGKSALAEGARNKARAIYEQQIEKNPNDAASALELANLLLHPDNLWTILEPKEFKSQGGATLNLQGDRSILASGSNPNTDSYSLVAEIEMKQVTAIRLEVLPDTSLPLQASGRAKENGNFGLSEFYVEKLPRGGMGEASVVRWKDALSDHRVEAANHYNLRTMYIKHAIDGDPTTHWESWPRSSLSHWAIFVPAEPIEASRLGINMEFRSMIGHNLGRFRLSISNDPSAAERTQQRLTLSKQTDPWSKLAGAYYAIGDRDAFEKVLKRHPYVAAKVAELFTWDRNWERAIDEYTKALATNKTDARLLAKRAEAYVQTKQWDRGLADWKLAAERDKVQISNAFDSFKSAERWNEAIFFGQKVVEDPEADSLRWLQVATILAQTAQAQDYSNFCDRMLKRFGDSTSASDVECVTRAGLLRPQAIELEKLPIDVLERMLDEGMVMGDLPPWGWSTRALYAVRRGDADSALKYVTRSEESKPNETAHALNMVLMALAEHQLQHRVNALTAVEEADRLITQLDQSLGHHGDHDVLIAYILCREAEALIKQGAKP